MLDSDKPTSATVIAKNLGRTRQTILRWADAGLIPCTRINARVILFTPSQVKAAVTKQSLGRWNEKPVTK